MDGRLKRLCGGSSCRCKSCLPPWLRNKFRFFLLAICFLTLFSNMACRLNMVFVGENIMRNEHQKLDPRFNNDFNSDAQSLWSGGFCVGALASLTMYRYYQQRKVFYMVLLLNGIHNIAIQAFATLAGPVGVQISRFFVGLYSGFLTSIMYSVANNWFTPTEKIIAITIGNLGYNVGVIIWASTGYMIDNLTWYSLFWLPGVVSLLTGILVFIFFTDNPAQNWWCGQEEKKLLSGLWPTNYDSFTGQVDLHQKYHYHLRLGTERSALRPLFAGKIPIIKMLGNRAVLGVLIGTFGSQWASDSAVIYTQPFLQNMLGLSISDASYYNALPTQLMYIACCLFLAPAILRMTTKGRISKRACRIFGCLLLILSCGYFILLGVVPTDLLSENHNVWIPAIMVFGALRFGHCLSISPSMLDITPSYQDNLMSVTGLISQIPGWMIPLVSKAFGMDTINGWRMTLFTTVGVVVALMAGYLCLLSVEVQDFDPTYKAPGDKELIPRQYPEEAAPDQKAVQMRKELQKPLPSQKDKEVVSTSTQNFVRTNWPIKDASKQVKNIHGLVWELVSFSLKKDLLEAAHDMSSIGASTQFSVDDEDDNIEDSSP